MEFYEVLKTRRSIRGYKPDAIPENVLNRIAEAVNLAPTACNKQPFKLLLVRDPEMKKSICANCKFGFLAEAPVIAVMMTNESASWTRYEGNPAADIDASIAMEHFVISDELFIHFFCPCRGIYYNRRNRKCPNSCAEWLLDGADR